MRHLIAMTGKENNNLYMLKASIEMMDSPWVTIGVSGKWEGHIAGTFEMNQNVFEQMISNFDKGGIDIVCDYEHQTLYGETAPASGWITREPISLKVENGTLQAKIEWTQKAKAHIEAKEYRYLSPVFAPNTLSQTDASNIGWTLHSVALTNKPFLEELGEVRLNKLTQIHHQKENETMTEAEKQQMKELQDANAQLEAEKVALKNTNTSLEDQIKTHKDKEAEATVDAAIAAKKLHPDQKDASVVMCKKDPEGFAAMMEKAKPMIQVPNSDMFENSNNGAGDDVDVVALALKNQ